MRYRAYARHNLQKLPAYGKLDPQQIEAIRQFVDTGQELPDVELNILPGSIVNIIAGPMKGISGELLEIMGKKKVRI